MKRVFLGWTKEAFPRYVGALTALGAAVERADPEGCDALLLPGGGDLHPRLGGTEAALAEDVDEARDEYELALFRRFFADGRPILGVCRGAQLINAALGGTLRSHVGGHSRAGGADRTHAVTAEDPWLRALYGRRFAVNSAHHQAADRPGAGLLVCARAEDGVIEALRHTSRRVYAVQWHPERLPGGEALLRDFLERI